MGESLTQPCRVSDEGLRVVKLCPGGRMGGGLIGLYVDGTPEESTG